MQEKPSRLLLVEDNPGDARLVWEMLSDAENNPFQIQTVDSLVGALSALSQGRFDVVLLDLSLPDSNGLETLLAVERHAAGIPIVLLTGLTSESMALAAVKRGAQDYLVKGTLTPESLLRALQYAIVRHQGNPGLSGPASVKAKIVGVLGAKGGVGVTTFACCYAQELKCQSAESVLLVDLDPAAASAAFLMKAQSRYTALDAASSLSRLDQDFWKGIIATSAAGVDLLQSPGVAGASESLDGERIRHVLRFARGLYRWIVLDLGRWNTLSMTLLDEVSELFVMTTTELPSFYEAGRLLRKLQDLGRRRENMQLVINRKSKAIPCPQDEVEKALGYPINASMGDYTSELHEAYGSGHFLDGNLQLQRQVAQLVSVGLGKPAAAPKSGMKWFQFVRAI
ncbi:MAG: response regulator [Bryobacteraceae bacterium]